MQNIIIDILPVGLLFLLFYKAKPVRPFSAFNDAYLDIVPCRSVRAFFALAIILHHLSQHTSGGILFSLFPMFSFTVPIFFFLSGYGVMKKHIKSPDISSSFLPLKLIPLIFPLAVVLLVFQLLYFIMGEPVSVFQLLYMVIHGDIILVIFWYMFMIILLYFVYGLSILLFKNRRAILLITTAFSILLIYLGNKFNYGQWWYNSFHLFSIGLCWALYEDNILVFVKKHFWMCFLGCGFIFLFVWQYFDFLFALWPVQEMRLLISLVRNAAFTLAFVLMGLKLRLGNPILDTLGKISFELYLLHPVFLLLFRSSIIYISNDFLFCITVLFCTVSSAALLSGPYKLLCRKYTSLLKA